MTDVYQVRYATQGAPSRSSTPDSTGAAEAAEAAFHRRLEQGAERRASSASWSSSMCEADLACLMGVLEKEVLPRLVSSYRPADGLQIRRCLR